MRAREWRGPTGPRAVGAAGGLLTAAGVAVALGAHFVEVGGGAGPAERAFGDVPGQAATPTEPGRATATPQVDNVPYDGRFTFVRIRFRPEARGLRGFGFGGREPPWAHDYPRAERNLMRLLSELTYLDPYLGGGNIFTTDDPELFRYPLAYLSEPGFWTMDEAEVRGLREWLLKGGFLIVDDFRGADWMNFEAQMRRVLPESRPVQLDLQHPVFDSFFRIESLDFPPPYGQMFTPAYVGYFEDDDPSKRLMVVVNYNNDIGDYWEWSDAGFLPIELSNEAYKLGVNYIVYAMTH